MQNWEKELRSKRIQEIQSVEGSCEVNYYENRANSEIRKSQAKDIIIKAVVNGTLPKEVLLKL